jgi:hypothetical protein
MVEKWRVFWPVAGGVGSCDLGLGVSFVVG